MNPAFLNSHDPADKPHIQPKPDMDPEIFALLVQICPAGLYWRDENGIHYDYTHCLECGVCRIIAGEENFIIWNYPPDGKGVDYGKD